MTAKKEGRDKKAKNQNVKRKGKRNISINIENRRRRIVTVIQKQSVQGKIDNFCHVALVIQDVSLLKSSSSEAIMVYTVKNLGTKYKDEIRARPTKAVGETKFSCYLL